MSLCLWDLSYILLIDLNFGLMVAVEEQFKWEHSSSVSISHALSIFKAFWQQKELLVLQLEVEEYTGRLNVCWKVVLRANRRCFNGWASVSFYQKKHKRCVGQNILPCDLADVSKTCWTCLDSRNDSVDSQKSLNIILDMWADLWTHDGAGWIMVLISKSLWLTEN